MLLKYLKTKNIEGNIKTLSKREAIGRLCIGEVRVDLEHLCSCSWKQCRIFHGSFSQKWLSPYTIQLYYINNVPRFTFRVFKLLVWCMLWKNRNFCCSVWILIIYRNLQNFEIFTQYWYANFLFFPSFSEFLELQKYMYHLLLYRLSCFHRLLL